MRVPGYVRDDFRSQSTIRSVDYNLDPLIFEHHI